MIVNYTASCVCVSVCVRTNTVWSLRDSCRPKLTAADSDCVPLALLAPQRKQNFIDTSASSVYLAYIAFVSAVNQEKPSKMDST